MNKTSGFTLVELMIVIAIIGILASIAIPQFDTYVKKAKFSEVLSIASDYKSAIGLCLQLKYDIDLCDSETNGIPESINNTDTSATIKTLVVKDGVIDIVTGSELDSITVKASPQTNQISIKWTITGSCKTEGYC